MVTIGKGHIQIKHGLFLEFLTLQRPDPYTGPAPTLRKRNEPGYRIIAIILIFNNQTTD